MPRWLLCFIFLATLGFCRPDCYGQTPDSTTRKPSIWTRARKAMEEQRQAVEQQMELKSYTYQLENIIFGGALWFGGRIRISQNHRWRLEPSIGLGIKSRTVVWHGVPEGYKYEGAGHEFIDPFPASPRISTPVTFYLPASVRLIYVL